MRIIRKTDQLICELRKWVFMIMWQTCCSSLLMVLSANSARLRASSSRSSKSLTVFSYSYSFSFALSKETSTDFKLLASRFSSSSYSAHLLHGETMTPISSYTSLVSPKTTTKVRDVHLNPNLILPSSLHFPKNFYRNLFFKVIHRFPFE